MIRGHVVDQAVKTRRVFHHQLVKRARIAILQCARPVAGLRPFRGWSIASRLGLTRGCGADDNKSESGAATAERWRTHLFRGDAVN